MILASVAIYYSSSEYRRDTFYDRLRNKARITASILLEGNVIGASKLESLEKRNPVRLNEEKIIVLNILDDTIYTTDSKKLLKIRYDVLENVRQGKEVLYRQGTNEVLASLYRVKSEQYVVLAAGRDVDGYMHLERLRNILIIVCIVSLLIFFIAGWFYSERALKPISDVVKKVDRISITSLNLRVPEGNGEDEIGRLAGTFNRMLERLETSFAMQKDFIANASHELRTPLTAIYGQLDVLLMKDRSKEDYKAAICSVFEDMKVLVTLANNLLLMARTSAEGPVNFDSRIRVDEILWQVREEIARFNKENHIGIILDESLDDTDKMSVSGDEFLLKTAISNIIDNACKYSSDHTAEVLMKQTGSEIVIVFTDHGIGIPPEEIKKIFEPFYRSSNAITYSGSGIGLSLVNQIVKMHNGRIDIDSKPGKGTRVSMYLPLGC
jgi:signal transduction histidine kinase